MGEFCAVNFAVASLLAILALVTLAAKSLLEWKMRHVYSELQVEANPEA